MVPVENLAKVYKIYNYAGCKDYTLLIKNYYMKTINTLILIAFSLHLTAQFNKPAEPYERLEFKNIIPDWYVTAFDSTHITATGDGYNKYYEDNFELKPLKHGDHIYTVYQLEDKKGKTSGVYIEKRSLINGEIVWKNNFGLTDNYNRGEVIRYLKLDENEDLILVGQRLKLPFPQGNLAYFASRNTQLNIRVYNKDNGELKYLLDQPIDEESSYFLHYYQFNTTNYNYIFNEDDGYRVIAGDYYDHGTPTYIAKSYYVNSLGKQQGKIDTITNKDDQVFFNIAQISQDTFVRASVAFDKKAVHFEYMDKNLNIIKSFYSETLDGIGYHSLNEYKNGDYAFYEAVPDTFGFLSDAYITWYNKTGKRISRFLIPEYTVNYTSILNDKNELYFAYNYAKRLTNTTLDTGYTQIIKFDNNGNFNTLVKIYCTDNNRGFIVKEMIEDENGDLILWINETNIVVKVDGVLDFDQNATARSIIRIKAEDLVSSTGKELSINIGDVKIVPNPTYDQITISKELKGDLQIFDMDGKIIKSIKDFNSKNSSIDVSELLEGKYHIRIFDSNNNLNSGSFIKVK